MTILVRTNEAMKQELLNQGLSDSANIRWVNEWPSGEKADVLIDLLFQPGDVGALKKIPSRIIFISSISMTLKGLPENFIRINGWPTFLQRPLVEAACNNATLMEDASSVMGFFNKSIELVADMPGFIAARVMSMIINEAFFALQEGVSTREEIDTAMRLGTNYPYGPFEWSRLIGIERIHSLLEILSLENKRYEPCALLKREAVQ